MSAEADIPDRDEAMLARWAELDLAAAERVHGRLMTAEANAEIAELGRTYQRLARSLRQTLAIKARLKRERARAVGEAQDAARRRSRPNALDVSNRMRELRRAVTRVIAYETEREAPDDADLARWDEEGLDEIIAEESLSDHFCDESLDDHVARVCKDLALQPQNAARWKSLRDPPRRRGDHPPWAAEPEPEPPDVAGADTT